MPLKKFIKTIKSSKKTVPQCVLHYYSEVIHAIVFALQMVSIVKLNIPVNIGNKKLQYFLGFPKVIHKELSTKL